MTPAPRILIVGGGIGGLTLAALLRRSGLLPELVERASEWGEVGAGITLGLNAMAVLDRIGARVDAESRGRTMRLARITDEKGQALAETDFGELAAQYGNSIAIHRAKLHDCLLKAAGDCPMRLGVSLTAAEQNPNSVIASFSDGSTGSYDALIGADGIRSTVRKFVSREDPIHYSGYTCWRFLIEGDFGADAMAEMWGRGKRFGVVPLPERLVYCFATLNAPANESSLSRIRIDKFRELFREFGWVVPDILAALSSETQLIHNDLEEVRLDRWVRDRIALLGDAAHAMTPNMGQGAAMTMEDAVVLAREIVQAAEGKKMIAAALDEYQRRRWKRVGAVQSQSWRIGRVAQWETSLACAFRNALLQMTPNRVMISNLVRLLAEPI